MEFYKELAELSIKAAYKAGEQLRQGFGTSFNIVSKAGKNNLVTEYDHIAEDIIIGMIKEKYPDHEFLAEESGKTGISATDNVRWLIDPLDGTVNFAHNIPIFSISIAAEYRGEVVAGVVYQPILDEMFLAVKGMGASLNGKPIRVSENDDFFKSMLVTGFPYNVDKDPLNCVEQFVAIIQAGIPVRRLGSAALDLAYVACGRFDGFWEIDLYPWDVAAGSVLVTEAGGKVTQYNQEPYKFTDRSILATNNSIHESISQVLCNCEVKYDI